MENHEQIKMIEIHVLENKVPLLFRPQLIWQMKHQYSTCRLKHTLNVSEMVYTYKIQEKKSK